VLRDRRVRSQMVRKKKRRREKIKKKKKRRKRRKCNLTGALEQRWTCNARISA
jgi:hypothetical protein